MSLFNFFWFGSIFKEISISVSGISLTFTLVTMLIGVTKNLLKTMTMEMRK